MERHPPAPLKSYPNNLSIASVLIEDDGNLDPLPVNKKRRDLKTVPVEVDGMNGQLKTKQTRGRKGKLRQLPEMPLDILFEVCTSTYCDTGSNSFTNRYLVTSTLWMSSISPKLRKVFDISLCAGLLYPSGNKHVQTSVCQNAARI